MCFISDATSIICRNAKAVILLVFGAVLLNQMLALTVYAECPSRESGLLTVEFVHGLPVTQATVDGKKLNFSIDSGAYTSVLKAETANSLNLKQNPLPWYLGLEGVGGGGKATQTVVSSIQFNSKFAAENVQFIVFDAPIHADGVIGENVLGEGDIEYNFRDGSIRLFKPSSCRPSDLAYWNTEGVPSIIDIQPEGPFNRHVVADAAVDGVKMRVLFDSGAATSLLSLEAAAKVGLSPESKGVMRMHSISGMWTNSVNVWLAPIASFNIGNEEFKDTAILIGETHIKKVDIILGMDFLMSHRIYFAKEQRKAVITYNGGPVFFMNPAGTSLRSSKTVPDESLISRQASAESLNDGCE